MKNNRLRRSPKFDKRINKQVHLIEQFDQLKAEKTTVPLILTGAVTQKKCLI